MHWGLIFCDRSICPIGEQRGSSAWFWFFTGNFIIVWPYESSDPVGHIFGSSGNIFTKPQVQKQVVGWHHQFLVHQVHQSTSTPGPGAPKHQNTSSWAWSDPYFKPAWVAMMTVKQGVIGVILQKHWRRWWNVYYRHLPTPPDAALGVVSLHCCTFLH